MQPCSGCCAEGMRTPVQPTHTHRIRSRDGTALAVQEWGNPAGPPILFIHGGLQAHPCWDRQVSDPVLTARHRLVTFDLRGHGLSDKPVGVAHYRPAEPWAHDLAAIIAGLGLVRPVLVGWSFGGRVIGDYLTLHGAAGIGAINFVAAATVVRPEHLGPGIQALDRSESEDLRTMLAGTAAFVRACFSVPQDASVLDTVLAYNMLTPLHVRRSMRGRPAAYAPVLSRLRIPVLATHGLQDTVLLPGLSQDTAALIPGCGLSLLPGVGHSPFWEDAARFNQDLAALADQVSAPTPSEMTV